MYRQLLAVLTVAASLLAVGSSQQAASRALLDPRDQRAGLVVTNDTTSWCPTPTAWNHRYSNWGCPYYNCQDLTKTLNDTVWLATFSHAISEGGAGGAISRWAIPRRL